MNIQSTDRVVARLDSVFSHALRVVAAAWLAAAAALIGLHLWLAPQHLAAVVMVTVLSGMVAIVALLPGLLLRTRNAATVDHSAALMASVILRLLGTVALFLLCRYHLAATDEFLAAIVVGWYLFLTIVEVTALVNRLPELDVKGGRTGRPEMTQHKRDLTSNEISLTV